MIYNKFNTSMFAVMFALSTLSADAQQPIKYVVFSATTNVSQYENGKKNSVEKGLIIDEKTILDIPAGAKIQVIDCEKKQVFEIVGKAKNRLAVLVKSVNNPMGLTGKFLAFLKDGLLDRSSISSMHEQKTGAIFRDDDLLLDIDSIPIDTLNNTDTILVKKQCE